MRMRHIVFSDLVTFTLFFHIISFSGEKVIEHKTYFDFLCHFFP